MFFPIKVKKVKKSSVNAPWVNQKLKFCFQNKFKLYNVMRRGIISKQSFKTYKRLLIYVTKKMKEKYYSEKFNSCRNDSKKTWSQINNVLQRNKSNVISKINLNGNTFMGSQLPHVFNNYFANVVSSMVGNLSSRVINCHNVTNNLYFNINSCFFTPTNYDEIFDLLKTMGNKGNPLYDITFKFIRLISHKIIPILVYIYNLCLEQGIYPDLMKISRVVPLHKSGSFDSLSNYRPISTLISFNKIFERLTFNRINEFMNFYYPLSHNQFGFRKNSLITLAIFTL